MIGFVIVALLVCGALIYVTSPLRRTRTSEPSYPPIEVEAALERKRFALEGILDSEEEREIGKLTETDYRRLRARYEEEALTALRALQTAGEDRDAELEAEIARLKASLVCPECGEVRRAGSSCSACGAL